MSLIKTWGRPDVGFLVFQHENYDDQGYDLASRAGQRVVRITGRLDTGEGLGSWQEDPDYRSDLLGSNHWLADFKQRQISGCSFGWGSRIVKGSGRTGIATGGKAKSISTALLPVLDDQYTLDNRFSPKTVSNLDKASWGKHPIGTLGIVHSGTYESTQTDVFFRADGRLTAPNFDGDPEMGSIVYDLTADGEYDKDRGARLQSAFRVIRKTATYNVLGFQLSKSGLLDTEGGWFADFNGKKLSLGLGAKSNKGPFDCGDENDKHFINKDADGNPVCPVHWSTETLIKKNTAEDGPFNFERWRQGKELDTVVPVHCGFDGAKWSWWTTSALYPVPTEPTRPRPRPGVPTLGNVTQPITSPVRPPIPTGTSNVITASSVTGAALRLLASLAPIAAPALAVRPQNYQTGQTNTGMFQPPDVATDGGVSDDEATNAANQAKEAAQNKADTSSPITGMSSAFGAQGGSYQNSGSNGPDYTGSEGDPWVYTSIPKGTVQSGKPTSKFLGGTANGGIVYHPPETDLRDISAGLIPPNTTLSTMYVLAGPGAYFGAGLPQLVNGRIKDGWSWGMDTSTADLLFRSHVSSAAPSTGIVFVNSSQNFRWYSGQSYYGEFDHAVTANRTYTFPDKSGTVAMTSDIGTGVSALFTATANGSQTGIVTDASIVGSGSGSMTLAAAYLTVGKTFRLKLRGHYTTAAVPGNLNIKVFLGAATMLQTGNQALAALMSSQYWELECTFTCRTTGVGGDGFAQGAWYHMETAGAVGTLSNWSMVRTAVTGVDTTNTNLIDVAVTFDTAGNTITCTNITLEGIN